MLRSRSLESGVTPRRRTRWSCPSRAGRWPAPRSPWAPGRALGRLGSGGGVAGISGWVSSSKRPEPAGSFHSCFAGGSGRAGPPGAGDWAARPAGRLRLGLLTGRAVRRRGAPALVGIERHQRSWLIRWEFLADFACGFRSIGCASGASSHAAFNTLSLPEYHTCRGAANRVHSVTYSPVREGILR
jgi:hypothetical protein